MLASKARLCGDVGVPAECMQTQQGDVPLQLVPPIFSKNDKPAGARVVELALALAPAQRQRQTLNHA